MSKDEFTPDIDIPEIYDAGYDGLHYDNLFDQDETVDGELIDLRTGEPYDNSTQTDEQLFEEGEDQVGYVFDPDGETSTDDVMDPAAAWLAEHDVPAAEADSGADHEPPVADTYPDESLTR